MSSDARAFSRMEALSKGQFIIGADEQQMLAPVTEEGLFDEGFKMAAKVQVQNEASVENLVDVENTAMVRPRVCERVLHALMQDRKGYVRIKSLERLPGEERRLARDRDEGSQPSRPNEQTPASLRQIPKTK